MTTGFIKINFGDKSPYFNIWIGSDADITNITKQWNTFLDYVYLEEAQRGNKDRLNFTYLASNFVRFLSESYLNKTSFNSNRVCIAPDSWVSDAIFVYEITPIANLYSDFKTPIKKAISFVVLKKD